LTVGGGDILKAVIVGAGEVGFHLASVLSREGHEVSVIDRSSQAIERVNEGLDVLTVIGHGASVKALRNAEVARADLYVAVTDSDEVNLLSCLAARSMGAKRTVARLSSWVYLRGARQVYRGLLGVDLVISPEALASAEITKAVKSPAVLSLETFAAGKVLVKQLKLDRSCKFVRKQLKDVHLPEGTLVAGVLRGGEMIIPRGEDSLQVGDSAYVIGKAESMARVEKIFGLEAPPAQRVVIMGGGEVGFQTAQMLRRAHLDVRIIEKDEGRCAHLSEYLQGVTVLHGDGTQLNFLREELSGIDLFVGASGDDEVNILSALLAKELGAKKSVVVVEKPDYTSVYTKVGVDQAISPRQLAANAILRFLRRGDVVSVAVLEDGKAEVLEVIAGAKSRVVGKKLSEARFPKGSLVGAIVRENEVIVPRGDDLISRGETVILFVLPEVLQKVGDLFQKL
jgi:trk system potassium uptake protein TrkA